jgi:hypothetical protein
VSESGKDYRVLMTETFASGPPAIDPSGFVYPTALGGGNFIFGTIFRVGKDGSNPAKVHEFSAAFDGGGLAGGLATDAAGRVVGATVGRAEFDGGALFRIEPGSPELSIAPASLPDAATGVPYPPVHFTVSNGIPPYRFGQTGDTHQTGLPDGFSLSEDGVLSGITNQAESRQFGISVEDADGFVNARAYSMTVVEAGTAPPPTATSFAIGARAGRGTVISLRGSDPTHAASRFTFEIVAPPQFGALTTFDYISGVVTYTPMAGYVGPDSFQFDTRDEFGQSQQAFVSIDVFEERVIPVVPASPKPIVSRRRN